MGVSGLSGHVLEPIGSGLGRVPPEACKFFRLPGPVSRPSGCVLGSSDRLRKRLGQGSSRELEGFSPPSFAGLQAFQAFQSVFGGVSGFQQLSGGLQGPPGASRGLQGPPGVSRVVQPCRPRRLRKYGDG